MPLLSLGQGNYWTTGGVLLWLIWLVVVVGLLFVWYCNYLVVLWCSLAVGCCHLFSEHTWLAGIVLCGDVLSGWFCLNCCAQCITMHLLVLLQPQCTHTQLLLLATVLVSILSLLSSPLSPRYRQAMLLWDPGRIAARIIFQVTEGGGAWLYAPPILLGGGAQISMPTTIEIVHISVCMYVCMYAAMDTLK